jgi:hypothetical protein
MRRRAQCTPRCRARTARRRHWPAAIEAIAGEKAGILKAGIPVVTIDGAKNGSTVLNVTSDNYVLGKTMTEFLFSAIGPDGKIVRFFHSAHPGVRQREQVERTAIVEACVEEGIEVKMKSLPKGITCHHHGHLDDPDFNNVHVEIQFPK